MRSFVIKDSKLKRSHNLVKEKFKKKKKIQIKIKKKMTVLSDRWIKKAAKKGMIKPL